MAAFTHALDALGLGGRSAPLSETPINEAVYLFQRRICLVRAQAKGLCKNHERDARSP